MKRQVLFGSKQRLKLIVYALLLVNFSNYVLNDIEYALHHSHPAWRWYDWTASFATTIDQLCWFVILFLLEMETYLLSDDVFTKARMQAIHLIKAVCYVWIGHTVIVYALAILDLASATEFVGTTLCNFSDQGLSFTRNLTYWALDASNCLQLSEDSKFFLFSKGQAITDTAGMHVERQLAWADLFEATVWISILFLIELSVKLQDRGISSSALLSVVTGIKAVLYAALWLIAGYWAYRGHWLFAWDEALWILGFIAISINLANWRRDLMNTTTALNTTPVK